MPSPTLLSIVIPAYNVERYIGAAIESCLNQSSQQGWELIVVDDGSTDSTRQCVEEYQSDPRVKLLTQANAGIATARNHAIRQAAGTYIALLDGDDYYRSGTLAAFLKACDENKGGWALLYCDYEKVNENGELIAQVSCRAPLPRPHLYAQLLLPGGLPILPSNVVLRKAALDEVGYFDERFLMVEDVEMWSRIVHKFPIAKMNIVSTCRRIHGTQISKDRSANIYWREEFNLAYLKRHGFGYFCPTQDPVEQSCIAEEFGDRMLTHGWMLLRSAAHLYETSLCLNERASVRNKLEKVSASLAARPC